MTDSTWRGSDWEATKEPFQCTSSFLTYKWGLAIKQQGIWLLAGQTGQWSVETKNNWYPLLRFSIPGFAVQTTAGVLVKWFTHCSRCKSVLRLIRWLKWKPTGLQILRNRTKNHVVPIWLLLFSFKLNNWVYCNGHVITGLEGFPT